MKTPNKAARFDARNNDATAKSVRRKRVLPAFDCESLEGRKLMTGFAGATGAMMGHGPADMANIDAGQFAKGDWHGYDANSDGGVGADATTDLAGGTGAHNDAALPDRGGFAPMSRLAGGMDANHGGFAPMSSQTGTNDTQFQTDLTKLRTDEQAIHDKSQVTPVLEAAVRKDMEAINAAKTTAASTTALTTLHTDEQTIFSGNTAPTTAQQSALQADHDAVLLSEGVSQTLITQLDTDQAAIKTASNFTPADQATLAADQAALKADRVGTGSSSTTASTSSTSTTSTSSTDSTTATPAVATTSTATSTDPTTTQTTSTASVQGGAGSTTHRFGMSGGDRSYGGVGASDRTASANFRGDASGVSANLASSRDSGAGQNLNQATSFGGRGLRPGRA